MSDRPDRSGPSHVSTTRTEDVCVCVRAADIEGINNMLEGVPLYFCFSVK